MTAAVVALAVWAFRYQITQDKAGNTIRVNRFTGEIAIINCSKIKLASEPIKQRATELREWPRIDLGTLGASATVSTVWRDGKIYFRAVIAPFNPHFDREINIGDRLTLILRDANGFPVIEKTTYLMNCMQLLGSSGQPEAIQFEGAVDGTLQAYGGIAGARLAWANLDHTARPR